MLAEQAAREAAKEITMAVLKDGIDTLGFWVLGLALLVLVVGFFLTRGQRRIARNQVELAELVRGQSPKGGEGPTGLA